MPKPEKPLYEDNQIKIDYLPTSINDHILYINYGRKSFEFIIPRGILSDLARTKRGGIASKINTFDPSILHALGNIGLSIDGLHVALCQAYMEEEEERMKSFQLE